MTKVGINILNGVQVKNLETILCTQMGMLINNINPNASLGKLRRISSDALKANLQSVVAAVDALQKQITLQDVKLGAMRGYLAETAPDFKQALNDLAILRAQLAKQSKDSATSQGQGSSQGDYITRFRDFKYQETLFEICVKQFEMAKLDEAREGAVIQVLDKAEPPERKSKPKKAIIAVVTSLATGFALLLFVFIRQALRNASQDPESAPKINALHASWRKALGRSHPS